MEQIKIVEIFQSIEGEGRKIGLPMIFIRLEGCNLRCLWCDTKHSYDDKNYTKMSLNEIIKKVNSFNNIKYITLTGGEPLYNAGIIPIIRNLIEKYNILIETNGTLWNQKLEKFNWDKIYLVCSPKPKEYFIHKKILDYCSELKFVLDEDITFDTIFSIIKKSNKKVKITFQPENNKVEFLKKAIELQNKFLKIDIEIRVIPQIHKLFNIS